MYVFDIESNGIQFSWSDWYRSLETVHCIVITCRETGKERRYRKNDKENTIAEGVKFLSDATHKGIHIGGHNIHGFGKTCGLPGSGYGQAMGKVSLCKVFGPRPQLFDGLADSAGYIKADHRGEGRD